MNIATMAEVLHETAEHHDSYEKSAPKHDRWDWYAAYICAREGGSTPDVASEAAARYMERLSSAPVGSASSCASTTSTQDTSGSRPPA